MMLAGESAGRSTTPCAVGVAVFFATLGRASVLGATLNDLDFDFPGSGIPNSLRAAACANSGLLRVDFVVVFGWHSVKGGKSLTESRREGCYPRGGRSSAGAESGTLSAPANRSMACRMAPARRIDSLHCRCLRSNLFASGGGAVAFIANIATNSSRVISDRGMPLTF